MHRGFSYRLHPTDEQAETLRQWIGVCRLIYNAALEQRDVYWRQYEANFGGHISFASQCRELTLLRAEFDWIRAMPSKPQQAALRDLDAAFSRFRQGLAGYPTPRRKGKDDAVRITNAELRSEPLNTKWARVLLPKLGWVKYRTTRPIAGAVKFATVSVKNDQWYVSFLAVIECDEAPVSTLPSVGIDRGVANTIALSTGERSSVPAKLLAIARQRRRANKALSRKCRGSRRYNKQRRRLSMLFAREKRVRMDWCHKTTTDIAGRFGTVFLEDLAVKDMTARAHLRHVKQKSGLNRSVLNQGWRIFETQLAYKLESRGGALIKVPPAYTSQTCSECGAIDSGNRKNQASFQCLHCGHTAHADINAAINILRGNTPSMRVEDAGGGTYEARTIPNQAARPEDVDCGSFCHRSRPYMKGWKKWVRFCAMTTAS